MSIERYPSPQPAIPPDRTALDAAILGMRDAYHKKVDLGRIVDAVLLFDRMGQMRQHADTVRFLGENPQIRAYVFGQIDTARAAGDDERVMKLIRVSHLMDHTKDSLLVKAGGFLDIPPRFNPLLRLAQLLGQTENGTARRQNYDLWFDEHKTAWEAKQAAAAASASAPGAGPRVRLTEWPPINTTGKSPEWTATMAKVEADWQRVGSGLLDDPGSAATLSRLKTAMGLLHETIRFSRQRPDEQAAEIQTMIEFLIPKIWNKAPVVNNKPLSLNEYMETFFRSQTQPSSASNVTDLDGVTQALFIHEDIRDRTDPLTTLQKRLIRKFYRQYGFSLHPDKTNRNPDTTIEVGDFVEILFKEINGRWALVNSLTS